MLGNLIAGFIVILVGVVLAPSVSTAVFQAQITQNGSGFQWATNITGAANTILGLTTLFYCLAVATTGMGIAVVGLREAGVM